MHLRWLNFMLVSAAILWLLSATSVQSAEVTSNGPNHNAHPPTPSSLEELRWSGAQGISGSRVLANGGDTARHEDGAPDESCDCGSFIGGTHNIDERANGSRVWGGKRLSDRHTHVADVWEVFPAQIGQHQAFLSFNLSYADIAKKDARTSLFRVRLDFMHPTPQGFPADDEFPDLRKVEDLLREAVVAAGGIQVGRLTVNGHREFYFYVAFPDEKAQSILTSVAPQSIYKLRYVHESDPEKEGYWKYLYPTDDDWQVIRDMRVLDTLRKEGDTSERIRHVSHWAYFTDRGHAEQFANWAKANSYEVNSVSLTTNNKIVVRFGHECTMELADISHHTIAINRKVLELRGDYDGWETKVARDR
jgi:hypothetical protein